MEGTDADRYRLTLRVAGLTIDVTSPDIPLDLDGAGEAFRVAPSSDVDVQLRARRGPVTAASAGERRLFDSGGVWTLDLAGTDRVFRFHSSRLGAAPYKIASLSEDASRGEVILNAAYFPPGAPAMVLEYPLDEVLFVNRIWRAGGVELHACAVALPEGTGALFIGHSGAGKSTMARLWTSALPDARILSDDRVVIREAERDLRMYGTPWHGDACFARAESSPISVIFVIGHGTRNNARRLSPIEAATQLFARAFIPFHDPAALDATLAILDRVARQVPVFALDVVPDGIVVDFARAIIAGEIRS